MPTGKHKGQEIDTLPTEYLTWLRGRKRLDAETAAEVSRVWADRMSNRMKEAAAPLLRQMDEVLRMADRRMERAALQGPSLLTFDFSALAQNGLDDMGRTRYRRRKRARKRH